MNFDFGKYDNTRLNRAFANATATQSRSVHNRPIIGENHFKKQKKSHKISVHNGKLANLSINIEDN